MVGDLELSRSRGDAKFQFRVERHDGVAGGGMLFAESPLLQGMTNRLSQSPQTVFQEIIGGTGTHERDRLFITDGMGDDDERDTQVTLLRELQRL
jgi:hypothetical protein